MKKFVIFYSLLTASISCVRFYKPTNFNYRVENPETRSIFYCDTLEFRGNLMGYQLNDSTFVLMSEYYGEDCFIDTLKPIKK